MRLLFPNSNIPSNVGNAFFYEGAKAALRSIRPNVEFLDAPFPPDNPFGLTPIQTRNAFRVADHVTDYDALLIAGPVFDKDFGAQHGQLLRTAREQGKPIILMSIGCRTYTDEERTHVASVLQEVRPDVLLTRDHETYESFGALARHAYDGVCFAFFVADAHPKEAMSLRAPSFMTATFDFRPEPALHEHFSIDAQGRPRLERNIEARRTKALASRAAFAAQRRFPTHLGPARVIRPSHRPARDRRLVFHKPGAFADFSARGYLWLYANTVLTVTDRLHAAVATMAYGNPAYLGLDSNRTKLFDNVPLVTVDGLTLTDVAVLEGRKLDQLEFLSQALSDLRL